MAPKETKLVLNIRKWPYGYHFILLDMNRKHHDHHTNHFVFSEAVSPQEIEINGANARIQQMHIQTNYKQSNLL